MEFTLKCSMNFVPITVISNDQHGSLIKVGRYPAINNRIVGTPQKCLAFLQRNNQCCFSIIQKYQL